MSHCFGPFNETTRENNYSAHPVPYGNSLNQLSATTTYSNEYDDQLTIDKPVPSSSEYRHAFGPIIHS